MSWAACLFLLLPVFASQQEALCPVTAVARLAATPRTSLHPLTRHTPYTLNCHPATLPPLLQGIPEGQEMELATMIIECCSNEKTFIK
jgi:hypothetical protein